MTKRKKDTPEKAAMREMMQTYLKENNVDIKSGCKFRTVRSMFTEK